MKHPYSLLSAFILVLMAALPSAVPAQQQPPPPPPPGGYDVKTLQNMYPTRPGYRHTVTQYAATYYNYIADKRARGEPLTEADRNGIAMLQANRTWPVPPQITEADRTLSNWIDRNDTYTSRGIIIGTHSATGRIDYDADSPAIERFREYYHSIPPGQRSTVANMMVAYYKALGFDMRTNAQRAADEARENPPEPTAAEKAAAEREKDNAERAEQHEKDKAYFEGLSAIERLKEKIKQSKEDPGMESVPTGGGGITELPPVGGVESGDSTTGGSTETVESGSGVTSVPGDDGFGGVPQAGDTTAADDHGFGPTAPGNTMGPGGEYVPGFGPGPGGHVGGGSDSMPPGGDSMPPGGDSMPPGGDSAGSCDGAGSCGQ